MNHRLSMFFPFVLFVAAVATDLEANADEEKPVFRVNRQDYADSSRYLGELLHMTDDAEEAGRSAAQAIVLGAAISRQGISAPFRLSCAAR